MDNLYYDFMSYYFSYTSSNEFFSTKIRLHTASVLFVYVTRIPMLKIIQNFDFKHNNCISVVKWTTYSPDLKSVESAWEY